MNKKIIMLFFAVILIFQFCLCAAAASQPTRNINNFKDVSQNDWFYVFVKRLYEEEIINGMSVNSYAPNAEVKTSEAAALIARYLGIEHMAEKCRNFLLKNNVEGAGLWYSGYIQLLCDTGIFGESEIEQYGLNLMDSGGAIISKNAAAIIDSPIKRMDIVKFIAKSFELKTGVTKTNRLLKSEISGTGNEFINGGGYDYESLDKIKYLISDYDNIPDEYKDYFLKCYYNGIIRGNEKSEVLPYNNLRRSELAKIIATVMYFDLRGSEIRDIPASCIINANDYAVSSANGSVFLKKEKAEQIIKEQLKNIKVVNLIESINVNISQTNIVPAGYLNEIYVYRYENNAMIEVGRVNSNTNSNEYFPKEVNFYVSKYSINSPNDFAGCIYMILRDLNRGGEVAGAVMYNIDSNGNLKDTPVYNLP
jgi:hypothetical protein